MTSRDFCYWLQGFIELSDQLNLQGITPAKTQSIKRHLALVFKHEIDPSAGSVAHQDELNKIHAPTSVHWDSTKHGTNDPGAPVYRC
jgi:hypothetical protein